ncbi:sulfite exporter TauE/SafE family protein [Sphingomonas sp. TX0543]|uniref:sulfite exporter TauE/SafE family protein n=1 Tax=Sphingomonas sp. TX0543 TaxID=3399682 RepID=UPI003AFB2885
MTGVEVAALTTLVAVAAALYSSVGHGGASAYLAAMALFAVPVASMRPTALTLNLVVAGLASFRYLRAGQFNFRLFLALILGAAPMAYLGGRLALDASIYRVLVGLTLWVAATRLLWRPAIPDLAKVRMPSWWVATPTGAATGLLAGLAGTGGGIFLSPVMLFLQWEQVRRISGIAAVFILVNSAAGLAGSLSDLRELPPILPALVVAVVIGAVVGTWLGVERLPRRHVERSLAIVLVVAGIKLVFS